MNDLSMQLFHVAPSEMRDVIASEGLRGADQATWHDNAPGNYLWQSEADAMRWAEAASEGDGQLRDVWGVSGAPDAATDVAWERDRAAGLVSSDQAALIAAGDIDAPNLRLMHLDVASPQVLRELALPVRPSLSSGLPAAATPGASVDLRRS